MDGHRRLPLLLDLAGKSVVVVGGGAIAERKVQSLIETGACVTVIAPDVSAAIEGWAHAGRISLERRPYCDGDLKGARLAFAATDAEAINRAVRSAADAAGIWLNVVDQPAMCDFYSPAVVRRGSLSIAISTDGRSPALARRLREKLEAEIGPEFEDMVERLGGLRDAARQRGGKPSDDAARIEEILARAGLPAPRSRQPGPGEQEPSAKARGTGKVMLVGAGPGGPDLLTLRGLGAVEAAEVVVFDALVDERILKLCRPDARLIYVGKRDSRHTLRQADINRLLVEEARAGRLVVRLKGGDPFVFGRGGEEAEALADSAISFEVVPGVSSGVAAPAYAGIPLTHRAFSSEVVFLSGHAGEDRAAPAIDWARYAPSKATLVIFMGLHTLPVTVGALLDHGRDGTCPVAVIQDGTLESQRVIVAPLSRIAEEVASARIEAPAIVVVGDVVRLSEKLRWFAVGGKGRSRT